MNNTPSITCTKQELLGAISDIADDQLFQVAFDVRTAVIDIPSFGMYTEKGPGETNGEMLIRWHRPMPKETADRLSLGLSEMHPDNWIPE